MDTKGVAMASLFLDEALASKSVRVIWIDPELFHQSIKTFTNAGDRRWSFTDCTSFELMNRLKIEQAFSFDHHFDQAGFQSLPK